MAPDRPTGSLSGAIVRAGAGMIERRLGSHVILEPLPQRRKSGTYTRTEFLLEDASTDADSIVRVRYSTLAGQAPADFSPGDVPPFLITVTESGYVWATVTFDTATGEITGRTIDHGTETPDDSADTIHRELGSYNLTDDVLSVANARYGPFDVTVCRDLYTNPGTYTVAWA